jgi:hypothetical protein
VQGPTPPSPWGPSEAEHKAAVLHNLGFERGNGAAIWAQAIIDLLALHESARESFAAQTVDREAWDRLHSSALMLVLAIDQVLTFERRVRRLTGDAELEKARRRFEVRAPGVEDVRDLIAHLDAYAVGQGERQTGRRQPTIEEPYLSSFTFWTDGGGTIVDFEGSRVNLREAAEAAIELAEVVEVVRERHLQHAEAQAQIDLRRRWEQYGVELPPE